MLVDGKAYHTIWVNERGSVEVIDQRYLPHKFVVEEISSADAMVKAIKEMHVRGAILIGVAGAYGVYLAGRDSRGSGEVFESLVSALKVARPTAVNLSWAVERMLSRVGGPEGRDAESWLLRLREEADRIKSEELLRCKMIGEEGVRIIEDIYDRKKDTVNILTHCNAGWLACVDYGTATAPVYEAHRRGIPVHVWVDETRPRNQGARLTAWELLQQGVPHTVIADNTGGHLMQHGMVDLVIVGADRVSRRGDVANKIGTYLKALSARDNGVPFYVALPTSSFDLSISDGLKEIPIEVRGEEEVKYARGLYDGEVVDVLLCPEASPALNYAFDVTPFYMVTGLITEKGIIAAKEDAIVSVVGGQ